MKKNYLLKIRFIIAMVMMTAMTAMAQPPMVNVEPGSKGQLPTNFPTIAPAQEGVIPALALEDIGFNSNTWDNYEWVARLAISFDNTIFGDHVPSVLQMKSGEKWETVVENLDSYTSAVDVWSTGTYRLLFEGGEVSNEVKVAFPTGTAFSKCTSWWREHNEFVAIVGKEVLGTFDVSVYEPISGKEYTVADGVYKYKWYRVNPNTGEKIAIEGATQPQYVPVIDDCGYNLVLEVLGDDVNCTFVKDIPIALVQFPVQASYDYIGKDGFVLNTDYVVPAEAFKLNMEYAMEENPGALEISQRKPGQYVFKGDVNSINGVLVELNNPVYLTFVYLMEQDWDGDGVMETINWNREVQIMPDRFVQPMVIKPMNNGSPVSTTVELIGRNIDNESTVVATAQAGADGATIEEVFTLGSGYYIKACAADGTLNTYYPSALLWQEGTAVLPGTDEEWNPLAFTIDVQSALPALTGKGTIEGAVQAAAGSIPAGINANTYTIYLKQKGGNFVASQETTANGTYRLENVPAGDYEVFVNIDGCTIEKPNEVTLTANKPNATGVNFKVEEFTITPDSESVEKIDFNEDGDMNVTDVVTLISCIAKNDFTSVSKEAADVNGDGEVNVTDVVTLILMIATAK